MREPRNIQIDAITNMRGLLNKLPFTVLVVLALTLGLAPFTPEPHVWEKMKMLTSGNLTSPVDIFDMLLHGLPWLLLILKVALSGLDRPTSK